MFSLIKRSKTIFLSNTESNGINACCVKEQQKTSSKPIFQKSIDQNSLNQKEPHITHNGVKWFDYTHRISPNQCHCINKFPLVRATLWPKKKAPTTTAIRKLHNAEPQVMSSALHKHNRRIVPARKKIASFITLFSSRHRPSPPIYIRKKKSVDDHYHSLSVWFNFLTVFFRLPSPFASHFRHPSFSHRSAANTEMPLIMIVRSAWKFIYHASCITR